MLVWGLESTVLMPIQSTINPVSRRDDGSVRCSATRDIFFALFAIVLIKASILALDASPRFFLWDSVTYLNGAVSDVLPRDRSFLYSLLIRAIALPLHSLYALVIAQTLAGIASALLGYFILRNFLHTRFYAALLGAVLIAIEPGQLFYERMVMAEAFGSTIWLGFGALVLAYVRDGRSRWLPAIALAGIATIAFRLNGTAVVLLIAPGLPLWRAWFAASRAASDQARNAARWRTAAQLALALACSLSVHLAYRHVVGSVAHTAPGYIGTEGLFLLGFVAPGIQRDDFSGTFCAADVLQHVQIPLGDPHNRERHLWSDNGLWAAMQRNCPQSESAASVVAERALRRISSKIVPMALSTSAQYFDPAEATWRMDSDLGRQGMLPLELIEPAKRYFSFDARLIAFTDTLTSVWFEHARWWFTGCFFLSPLIALWLVMVTRRQPSSAGSKMLALMVGGLFLSQFLFSPIVAFRYLHPFSPLLILCVIASRTACAPVAARTAAPATMLRLQSRE